MTGGDDLAANRERAPPGDTGNLLLAADPPPFSDGDFADRCPKPGSGDLRFDRPAKSHLLRRDLLEQAAVDHAQWTEIAERPPTERAAPETERGVGDEVSQSHRAPVAQALGAAAENEVVALVKRRSER